MCLPRWEGGVVVARLGCFLFFSLLLFHVDYLIGQVARCVG